MSRSLLKLSPLELIKRLTVDQWRAIDREWIEHAEPAGDDESRGKRKRRHGDSGAPAVQRTRFDWRPLVVLVVVAISLSLQEYYGDRDVFTDLMPDDGGRYWELKGFGYWSGFRMFGYVVIPVIAILLMPGERLRDYFVSFRGFVSKLWIYVGLFLIVLPAVIAASQTQSFRLTYPFYKLANRAALDFWAWQGLYALQFISLEFFFRGFMLRALAPRFGSGAIFVMVVPYCMIHFGKPLPETFGAIIAGTVLGTLALRTRSIWGGAFIHIAVALTMDSLALQHCPSAESGLPCPTHY